MEAMVVGLPVIATPNGGIPELIGPGAGILVPEYDAAALSDAICLLAEDGNLRKSLAKTGRDRVMAEFAIKGCMAQLEQLITRHVRRPL